MQMQQVDVVRRLVRAHLPGHPDAPVERVGEGADHVAYRVAGRLIVRFAKEADDVEREARLLRAVADVSPLPVPVPAFTDTAAGCLAYAILPGAPLLHLPAADRARHGVAGASVLGGFLAALHGDSSIRDLVDTDHRPAAEWLDEAREIHASVAGEIPAVYAPRIHRFLDTTPTFGDARLVFSHNDLGIEHVLVEPDTGSVTGVIDWSDAAVTDAATDFGRLARDLGPASLEGAIAAYGAAGGVDDAGLRERASFYARCLLLEDLAYGVETGEAAYAEKSLAALEWCFPA
jgi:aminoglycoside phosphotransferase (APT) family kinase protein